MDLADWFLTAAERGNPATRLDSRHPDGAAWTTGNEVRPLILDATVTNVALPSIGRGLHGGVTGAGLGTLTAALVEAGRPPCRGPRSPRGAYAAG